MTYFPEDLDETPEERAAARREFIELSEEKEMLEGDISVSETVDGRDPLPGIDDPDVDDDLRSEGALTVLDEDAPELGLSFDEEDSYLDDDLDDEDDDQFNETRIP